MEIPGPGFSLFDQPELDDRCGVRAPIAVPATLRPRGGRAFQTMLRDISISGFSAGSLSKLAPGTVCWLTLPGLAPLQAQVVWWQGSVVGCSFANLMSQVVLDNLVARWAAPCELRPAI